MTPPSKTGTTTTTTKATSAATSCQRDKHFDAARAILGEEASSTDPGSVAWPSRCTWSLGGQNADPHHHVKANYALGGTSQIYDSILDCIGQTPLVRLNHWPQMHGIECEILVKCEFMSPGGSVKDRVALRMVDEAEREGKLVPHSGYTIIEPTSGNTGIGLAMVAALRGYRCIIVMPHKMSAEKARVLRALGAEIVRTSNEAAYNAPDSHISKSIELMRSIPNSIILNQYRAPGNPLAHYDTTAEEILLACRGRVDMLVAGAGTGGTISGLARKLKERLPDCQIVGADPVGSILARAPGRQPPRAASEAKGQELDDENTCAFYEVEGIGYDFHPTVLDHNLVDRWIKTRDEQSLLTARELIRHEGLLVGGSSGAAMWAAREAIRSAGDSFARNPDKRVVVVLPDGVRNYMSKFLSDSWMRERSFIG